MNKLFPIVFGGLGLALLVFGSRQLRHGYASSHWPKTVGVIMESRLSQTGSGQKGFRPIIVYSYEVEKEHFSSERILFGMSSYRTSLLSGKNRAQAWLEQYPESKQVTVAYDPADPSQSTLHTGAHSTAWVAPVMGLSFVVAGLYLFRSSRRSRSSSIK